jgi:hypothetical protein
VLASRSIGSHHHSPRPSSFGPPVKHEVGEHRLAWIVHLATLGARCKDVAQLGNGNLRAVLGDRFRLKVSAPYRFSYETAPVS